MTARGISLTAQVWDHKQGPMRHAVQVEEAPYGLVAFQQGGPGEVSCVAGASPVEYLALLHAVIRWGIDSGIPRAAMTGIVVDALSRP